MQESSDFKIVLFFFRRRSRGGPDEFRRFDWNIRLYFTYLSSRLSVGPGGGPLEGQFNPSYIAVIRIVDLCGHTADRGVDKSHQPNQQTGLIKVEIYRRLPWICSLQDLNLPIIDASRCHAPLIEGLLELRGKERHSLDPGAFE